MSAWVGDAVGILLLMQMQLGALGSRIISPEPIQHTQPVFLCQRLMFQAPKLLSPPQLGMFLSDWLLMYLTIVFILFLTGYVKETM